MLFTTGLVLMALSVAMIVLARPANGVAAPFLTNWAVGQTYTLGALSSGVIGISFILTDLPI